MPTLAEDLLRLLLDDESGKQVVGSLELTRGLAGALLLDLAAAGRIVRAGKDDESRTGHFVVCDATPTGDPLLDHAVQRLGVKARSGRRAVEKLAKGSKDRVLERLAERGVVRRETSSVLGVISRTRWPAGPAAQEDDLRRRLSAVLLQGQAPDRREADLIALLHAVKGVRKVVDGDRKTLAARAKAISEDNPGGDAVREAVRAVRTAITAAIAANSAAASGS